MTDAVSPAVATPPSTRGRRGLRWRACAVASAGALWAGAAGAGSAFGTSYVGNASNFPGSDSAPLAFDGLAELLGASGLVVEEASASVGGVELVEFTLTTADGEPFVGQQDDGAAVSSIAVTGLHDFGEPTALQALADSGFAYVTIDGVPEPMSDLLSLGLHFGTHPQHPGIQVLLLRNRQSGTLSFDTFGNSAFTTFAALVGSTAAAQIDGVHFGVAVPEPTSGLALPLLAAALAGLARVHTRSRARSAP